MFDNDDHRSVAQRLDLFHLQDDAPGMVYWHPRGFALVRLLEDAVREHLVAHGYDEVRSPQILRRAVWEASGHWEHFRDAMFRIEDQACEAAVKPVSCPGHLQILVRRIPSYRELPIRLAEFGLVHRDEQGGALHGLLRLRQFVQDDGHVFCMPDQAEAEVERFCRAVHPFYAAFGFHDVSVALSLRPESRAGDDESWNRAESALVHVLERWGVPYSVQKGAGAFYGPKLEFILKDKRGREWQCGTIQFDLIMPVRFGARYVDAHGARQPLVMLHRALYGSLERFLGIVLEQHGAALPPWLAPEQVVVVPVSPAQHDRAREIVEALRRAQLRVRLDARSESLGRRIADAHGGAIPFIAVVGPREVEAGRVSLRDRREEGAQELDLPSLVSELADACKRPPLLGGEPSPGGEVCTCAKLAGGCSAEVVD